MSETHLIFVAMVFVAVLLLALGLVVPAFGEGRVMRRRLKQRFEQIRNTSEKPATASLLRDKYLRNLSPLEQRLESLPGMAALARLIEQAGRTMPAYRLLLIAAALGVLACLGAWMLTRAPLAALLLGAGAAALPFFKILTERARRMAKFEEQLPEAIDIMKRALRAGHPFSESLQLVAEEMDDPVGHEFGLTFADVNYGADVRNALLALLERMPSVTVMALVTSVLVQRETGGNLAEILEKIATVIRARFRFQRRVRTLSAEGRMSAWVLTLVPFVLFVVISITTPEYLPVLLREPLGRKLIAVAFVLMMIGVWWMRHIIRIRV